MESFFPILVILGVIFFIGVSAYLSYLAAKRRREEMARLAQELGCRFDPGKDHNHDDEYAHFEVFRRGHSRYAYNTLTGVWEIGDHSYPIRMGDFHYRVTSGSGKSRKTRTYRFSYLILHLPFRDVPDLLIRPEGMFDWLAGAFGFDDIDFESVEFSKKFYVKSPDKRFAYDVIDPRMMEFLLKSQPPTVDIEYRRCCLTDGKSQWTPSEFKDMLAWAKHFFGLWPNHVVSRLGG